MSEEVVLRTDAERRRSIRSIGWARVRSGKISFFGFFRTEEDALEAVSAQAT